MTSWVKVKERKWRRKDREIRGVERRVEKRKKRGEKSEGEKKG